MLVSPITNIIANLKVNIIFSVYILKIMYLKYFQTNCKNISTVMIIFLCKQRHDVKCHLYTRSGVGIRKKRREKGIHNLQFDYFF